MKPIDVIRVGVTAIVLNKESQVFLAQRGKETRNEKEHWEFPGGQVDFGEKLESAIEREFLEEYGMSIQVRRQFKTYEQISDENGEHWISIVYIADHISGVPQILEPHKCNNTDWFDIHNLPTPLTVSTQAEVIDYLNLL